MREIIYVQAGKFSNYTGTHFWNTQESYFAEDSAEKIYDFDVSFREGMDSAGRPVYCPRLLLFDHKSNFGTLSKTNALLGVNDLEEEDGEDSIWNGHITEYRHDVIPKSAYHESLDASDDYDDSCQSESSRENVRYWSDFNRVFYTPRSIQKVADPAEWENIEGDWNHGKTVFSEYDEENAVIDGSLRLFLEECDSPQGLQVMNDTSSFGGFLNSFLTTFRDEHAKLPFLVIPILSRTPNATIDADDLVAMRSVVNDAVYLRDLNDLTSITIPIQPLNAWPSELWHDRLSIQPNDLYQNSAVLSALLESATLPLRLKDSISLSALYGRMNWRGCTPFCELSGVFPFTDAADFDTRIANLSILRNNDDSSCFARLDVSRGLTRAATSAFQDWSSRRALSDTLVSSIRTTPYPLPTSYPMFFKDARSSANSLRKGIFSGPESCAVFASLTTSSQTAYTFLSYASAIETYLKKKQDVNVLGFERDDLQDLTNELWTLHDNFGGEDEGS